MGSIEHICNEKDNPKPSISVGRGTEESEKRNMQMEYERNGEEGER